MDDAFAIPAASKIIYGNNNSWRCGPLKQLHAIKVPAENLGQPFPCLSLIEAPRQMPSAFAMAVVPQGPALSSRTPLIIIDVGAPAAALKMISVDLDAVRQLKPEAIHEIETGLKQSACDITAASVVRPDVSSCTTFF